MEKTYLATLGLGILSLFGVSIFLFTFLYHPLVAVPHKVQQEAVQQPTATTRPIPQKIYSANEVALHSSAGDCWIIVSSLVYNATGLLKQYSTVISALGTPEEFCGKDQTDLLLKTLKQYGMTDSSQLTALLSQYAVGRVQ